MFVHLYVYIYKGEFLKVNFFTLRWDKIEMFVYIKKW